MIASENSRIHWWQREIEGPIIFTFACCAPATALMATFAFVIDGGQLAAIFFPMGVLSGATLSLRMSNDPLMRKWCRFADALLARAVKTVLFYGLPFWFYVAIKYGVGITVVFLGGTNALLLFTVSGTTGLAVAVSHTMSSLRKTLIRVPKNG